MPGIGIGMGLGRSLAAVSADVAAPTLSSATIGADGLTLTLSFSEAVQVGSGGNAGWTISPSAGAATLTYVSGSGTSSLVYSLSRMVYDEETATLDYTQPGDGIEDLAGNDLASISGGVVTNNSAEAAVEMDMIYTGAGTPGTVDTTKLAAQAPSIDSGTWALPDTGGGSGGAGMEFHADGAIGVLRRAVKVNGTIYLGNAATGFRIDNSSIATKRARRTFGTTRDVILCGFFLKCSPETDFNYTDVLNMESTGGTDWTVAQWRTNTTPAIHTHSAAGTTSAGSATKGQLYWIQAKYERNVGASVAFWSVSGTTYTYIGTATLALTNLACTRIFAPGIVTHSQTSPNPNEYYYSTNYIFKFSGTIGDVDDLMI